MRHFRIRCARLDYTLNICEAIFYVFAIESEVID